MYWNQIQYGQYKKKQERSEKEYITKIIITRKVKFQILICSGH